MSADTTPAHEQAITHRYTMHFPAHAPRASDPHYAAFNAVHAKERATARCWVGQRVGFDECLDAKGKPAPAPADATAEQPGLELHHRTLEFAVLNEVDLAALEQDFPMLTDPAQVEAWAESDANLMWLCAFHHRGHGGAHTASFADFTAAEYVRNLIS